MMAGVSVFGSPAFLFVVSEFYDIFAGEGDMITADAVCVLLMACSDANRFLQSF